MNKKSNNEYEVELEFKLKTTVYVPAETQNQAARRAEFMLQEAEKNNTLKNTYNLKIDREVLVRDMWSNEEIKLNLDNICEDRTVPSILYWHYGERNDIRYVVLEMDKNGEPKSVVMHPTKKAASERKAAICARKDGSVAYIGHMPSSIADLKPYPAYFAYVVDEGNKTLQVSAFNDLDMAITYANELVDACTEVYMREHNHRADERYKSAKVWDDSIHVFILATSDLRSAY